jgi:hypothetical protein
VQERAAIDPANELAMLASAAGIILSDAEVRSAIETYLQLRAGLELLRAALTECDEPTPPFRPVVPDGPTGDEP